MLRFVTFFAFFASALSVSLSLSIFSRGSIAESPTVLLVDKKTNLLRVAEYVNGGYRTVQQYHAVFGQVRGDKVDEGDLKTPEGIYQFDARLTPPQIKAKFGAMALHMDYPNAFDRIAGATGFDIMLHATDEPARLKRGLDSQGCIVVQNEQILEIQKHIRLNLTPILVFDELTDDYLKPEGDERLKRFFTTWVQAWEGKDLDKYVDSYHSEFSSDGKDKSAWRAYKSGLNQRYERIQVRPENILFFRHPKYSMVMFVQNYSSQFKSGQAAHQSSGTKTLLVAEENDDYRIIEERFTQGRF